MSAAMMGMLSSIGIVKGQPFKPTGPTAKALGEAIKLGYDIMQQDDRNRMPLVHPDNQDLIWQ
jgi:hypothetical protein